MEAANQLPAKFSDSVPKILIHILKFIVSTIAVPNQFGDGLYATIRSCRIIDI